MTRREPTRTRVAYVVKSAVGYNVVLACGHEKIFTEIDDPLLAANLKLANPGWERRLPPGHRPMDEVECEHCPSVVVDDYAYFEDLRRELNR